MNLFFSLIVLGPVLTGCSEVPDVSDVCRQMCTTATDLYGGCLDTWGMEWSDAGFENAAGHQETCEVWSWEVAELDGRELSDRLCEERAQILRSGECSDYTKINWNGMP